MIAYKVIFRTITKTNREDAEWLVEDYISVLLHNGQVCGEYFLVVQKEKLCAYLNIQGRNAYAMKYHCKYGIERLQKIIEFFGSKPQWKLIDDDIPKQNITWKNAPFLYLFTHMDDGRSPLCRGDSGEPISIYLIPGEHEQREAIYFGSKNTKLMIKLGYIVGL